jgi:hypothetical protein
MPILEEGTMRKWNRRVVRLLVVTAALAAVWFAIARYSTKDVALAVKCTNTACAGTCWADGTVENHGTNAVMRGPGIDCGIGEPGCQTESCH